MNSTIQSRFFTRLLGGLSLMSLSLLLPHNAKANTIAATGVNCITNSGIPGVPNSACVDQSYTIVNGSPLDPLFKTNLSFTAPGFLPTPAGPSGAFWVAQKGDVQFGAPVNDWRVTFTTPAGTGNITVTGTMAAEGSVAVALNGSGIFAGPQSLTQLGQFSVTEAAGTTNTLDFIFTGCISYPGCHSSNEPVYGLLVDPNWSPALPGTPLDTIPESVLFADGGVAPPSSTTPEPASFLLMGSGLLAMGGILRRRIFGR
jgi:PEP-CTERM motif